MRVDLAYPHARLAIEAQSLAWRAGRADLQRDCEKHNLLVRLGWRLLVFTRGDVRRRASSTADAVRRLLSGVETTFGVDATSAVASAPRSA